MEKIHFQKCKTEDTPLSVILLDIDNFKSINDTFGHPVGDMVLKKLSFEVTSIIRKTDVFARYGGEEFVILLPQTTTEDAYHLAEKIRSHLSKTPLHHNENTIEYTVSSGLASISQSVFTFDELLVHSDNALYHSKNAGKNKTTLQKT